MDWTLEKWMHARLVLTICLNRPTSKKAYYCGERVGRKDGQVVAGSTHTE